MNSESELLLTIIGHRWSKIEKKSYVLQAKHTERRLDLMQDGPEAQIKSELNFEIQTLEKCYLTIKNCLSGTEYDAIQIVGTCEHSKMS